MQIKKINKNLNLQNYFFLCATYSQKGVAVLHMTGCFQIAQSKQKFRKTVVEYISLMTLYIGFQMRY